VLGSEPGDEVTRPSFATTKHSTETETTGKSVEWSMHWNHPPSWPLPDDVALVPQFALTSGNFVLPFCSTDVAKLIAA